MNTQLEDYNNIEKIRNSHPDIKKGLERAENQLRDQILLDLMNGNLDDNLD